MSKLISKNALKISDPDLPFLASEAAIDIDNMLTKNSYDFNAIHLLAERLKNSIQFDAPNASSHSLMDPATLSVLGEAVAKSTRKTNNSHKIDNLLKEAAKIADLLSKETPIEDREELEKVREFCVALSRAALAYRKSIRDIITRPHPFRR